MTDRMENMDARTDSPDGLKNSRELKDTGEPQCGAGLNHGKEPQSGAGTGVDGGPQNGSELQHSRETEQNVLRDFERLTRLLIRSKKTITAMESCTAGMLASLITDTEGSSEILKEAFVTYSNEAKVRRGVPAEVIAAYGVYSEPTARAMAEAARKACGADIAVGITGTFSNADLANADSLPGMVCYAFAFRGQETVSFTRRLRTTGVRRADKFLAAEAVIQDLLPAVTKYCAGAVRT